MSARRQGDHADLRREKIFPGMFEDDPRGLFVMTEAQVIVLMTDVVEIAGGFEQEPFGFAKAVQRGQAVEKLQGQIGHMGDVTVLGVQLAHQDQDFVPSGGAHGSSRSAPKRNPRVLTFSSANWKCSITAS